MESKIKELAADLCPHCSQDCRQRLLIMDSQIEALRAERKELRKVRGEYVKTLDQLRAVHRINMKLINLIHAPQKTGESACRVRARQF